MMSIDASTTVRELLAAHPEVFEVLVARGMCADCRSDPPPVPLGHFAEKHCGGDVDGLLDEVNRAMATPG